MLAQRTEAMIRFGTSTLGQLRLGRALRTRNCERIFRNQLHPQLSSTPSRRSLPLLCHEAGVPSHQVTKEARRSINSLYPVTTYIIDVVKNRNLRPPNPILDSLKNSDEALSEDGPRRPCVPHFDKILPYHLDDAAPEVAYQYKVDLAELEVSILNVYQDSHSSLGEDPCASLMAKLDRIEAPIYQVLEIGRHMAALTSSDDKRKWKMALPKAERALEGLPKRDSKIIYNALEQQGAPSSVLATFRKSGAHLHESPEERSKLVAIRNKLYEVRSRLGSLPEFGQLNKQEQLQALSDIYNAVGLSRAQSKILGHESVIDMEKAHSARQATVESLRTMNEGIVKAFEPLIDSEIRLGSEAFDGAFLASTRQKNKGPALTNDEKAYREAKWSVRKLLTLDGVLRGAFDLWDSLLGIEVIEETHRPSVHDWDLDERLFHVYDKDSTLSAQNSDAGDGQRGRYLGSFYLDAYHRFDKEICSNARLLTQRSHQTGAPLALATLNVTLPPWKEDPSPLTWDDTHNLMFQLGMALQMILSTTDVPSLGKEAAASEIPVDHTDFLGYFMTLWLRNHGFLRRIAQLSQDEFDFEPHIIEILLKEHRVEKAKDLIQKAYLSALELAMYTEFDISGRKESLSDLQMRVAQKHISHDLPRPDDFAPILDMFEQQHEDNKNNNIETERIWKTYCPLWAEVIGTNLYDQFQRSDKKDFEQLGRQVRDLASGRSGGDPPATSTSIFQEVYDIN